MDERPEWMNKNKHKTTTVLIPYDQAQAIDEMMKKHPELGAISRADIVRRAIQDFILKVG